VGFFNHSFHFKGHQLFKDHQNVHPSSVQKPVHLHPRFNLPEDGLPCTEDWISTFESMLFGGIELGREPLDGSMQPDKGRDPPKEKRK